MAIEISPEDVTRAETFLETFLSEQVPQGRFTEGSALRDLTVKALAFAFAYLQKERKQMQSMQSLLSILQVQSAESTGATGATGAADADLNRALSQATDGILSNWFFTRKAGGFARGVAWVQVSRRQDYIVPANYRFFYDRERVFYPDVLDPQQDVVVRAEDMTPVTSVEGVIQGYQFPVRVIAAKTGTQYNIAAGVWQGGATFSPYAVRVWSTTKFEGGQGRETNQELISRANTSISVRNLVNARSISAVLTERFTDLKRLLVVGMGEPEMQRDRRVEHATQSNLHVGGHVDVYVELPRVQTTFEGRVGGLFVRPDGVCNVFRDSAAEVDWTSIPILPGDVLRVAGGIPEAPKDFVVKEVLPGELRVSTNTPFSRATDERTDNSAVVYYLFRPLQGRDVQLFPATGTRITGSTSRRVQNAQRVVLPGGAHYEILDVAVINPERGDPAINPATGFVHFPRRVNAGATPSALAAGEYRITATTPTHAQSMLSFEELEIAGYAGKTLRVVYETLASLDGIHSYVQDRFERVMAGNTLVRGFFPVYLSMTIPYRKKYLSTAIVDEDAVAQAVTDFINRASPLDILDYSDISYAVRSTDSNIGAVLPFLIHYELIVPDGRVLSYTTQDEVTLDPAHLDAGQDAGLTDPLAQCLSDRTVRYMTTRARITVVAV